MQYSEHAPLETSMPGLVEKMPDGGVVGASVPSSGEGTESWFKWMCNLFGKLRPSGQSLYLMLIVSTGVTLVGATTYILAKKYQITISRKQEDEQALNDELDSDQEYLQEVYDEIYGNKRKVLDKLRARARGDEDNSNLVPPPLITFAEVHERARELAQQRLQQRKVKLYFNRSDEYVMEHALPEI